MATYTLLPTQWDDGRMDDYIVKCDGDEVRRIHKNARRQGRDRVAVDDLRHQQSRVRADVGGRQGEMAGCI
jgi:hypothetical protein